ncbi:uncharacterized protein LOC143034409 isoform X5 [Oratosquilla oratoria]|uniref:uncharacterized protein LOC143034409 isoform X5 n=1 Tax=Oratosquilla oratoria TaxID=337810 RepID=UPI003F76A10A
MGKLTRSKKVKRQNIERARQCLKEKQEQGKIKKEEESTTAAPSTPQASTSHAHRDLTPPPPTPHHSPSPRTSSAKKKLEICYTSQPSNKRTVDDENFILKKSYLEELFTHVACGYCFGKLNVNFVRKFMDQKIDLECAECGKKCGDSNVKNTPVTNTLVYSTVNDEAGLSRTGADGVIGLGDCEPQVYVDVAEDPEDSIRGKPTMSDTEEQSASDRRKYIKIEDDTDVKIDISQERVYVETNEEFILPNRNEPMDTSFYIKHEPGDNGRVKQELHDRGRV